MHISRRLAALILAVIPFAASADANLVTTPGGTSVEMLASFPAGAGPFPTLVLAPGQGYHMRMPAMEQTTAQMLAQGIAVYRFNWRYFTKDAKTGKPSAGLSNELEDLQAVLQAARAEPRVAKGQLSVGGKSLGSAVAWKALALDKTLRAGVFLTPVCSRVMEGQTQVNDFTDENYPGIATESRPLLFVVGDRDPLCAPSVLYSFAAKAAGKTRVAIVGGDHGFGDKTLVGPAFDAAHDRNVNLVALISTSFVAEKTAE
jgi:predicted alpha/beta-hydrolase family hydrolase